MIVLASARDGIVVRRTVRSYHVVPLRGRQEKIMNKTMAAAFAIVLIAATHPVAAQSWPAKPIRAFIAARVSRA